MEPDKLEELLKTSIANCERSAQNAEIALQKAKRTMKEARSFMLQNIGAVSALTQIQAEIKQREPTGPIKEPDA